MANETVKSLITPNDLTVRKVFEATHAYFIDIYQREYKWKERNVETLLTDIEVRFVQHHRLKTNPADIKQDVLSRFEPYFLNTFLTHTTSATTSIVDGQQRLTTLLLILIKLLRVLRGLEANGIVGKTFDSKVLEKLVFDTDDFGQATRFKIYNENREVAFRALVDGKAVTGNDETQRRIAENYAHIDKHFDGFFGTGESVDLVKLTYYVLYLLDRISIVEIRIERQDNVAMIFEVVNDRGMGLKPYEILKGKLIGGLPDAQKEKANQVWSELQHTYFRTELKFSSEKAIDLDHFFRTFFRAKFADGEKEYEKFQTDYHYEMYRSDRIRRYFGDFNDRETLFRRIVQDIKYFAELYLSLRTDYKNEFLLFNKLLEQDQQYLLILSAIELEDPLKDLKVTQIAKKFDQVHVLLRLLDVYDSNEFQRTIYPLVTSLRNCKLEAIDGIFDAALNKYLRAQGVLTDDQEVAAARLFTTERLRPVGNKWLNFSKYVLLRIDRCLHQALDKPSFVGGSSLNDLEERFNRFGTRKSGLHLEHIYTHHDGNRMQFQDNGTFDEADFHRTRNLLGMVLLLKDKQNLSSNNELFKDKIVTYSKSNLIWNELLAGFVPGSDMKVLPDAFKLAEPILPNEQGAFPRHKVEARQHAVVAAIQHIWGTF